MNPDAASGAAPARVRTARALLLVIAAAMLFSFLGTRDLWAPDEPKYALVAREMIETGEFLIPHVNGAPYPDKPPLMFWAIAAVSLLTGGVTPAAAVLPSIVAALFVLGGTMRLARTLAPQADLAVELLAAGGLACAYRFVMQATSGQLDMLLCAFSTWAFVFLFETLETPGGGDRTLPAFLMMGLGTLAKGPVALVIPLGGVAAAAILTGRARALGRLVSWRAAAVFAAVVGAWLVPAGWHALATGRQEWLTDLLFRQTIVRYAASWHHHQPPWFFLVVPWYDFFPASALLPAALIGLARPGTRPGPAIPRSAFVGLAAASAFAVLFFSIPSGKRGLYLLPIYPLLALLIAFDLERRLAAGRRLFAPRAGLAVAGLALGALAVAVPAVVLGLAMPEAPAWLAAHGIAVSPWPIAAAFGLAALACAAGACAPRRWPAALAGPALAMLVVWVVLARTVYPAVDVSRSPARLVEQIRARVVPEARAGMVDFRAQFGFYAGRMLAARPGNDPRLDDLARRLAGDEPFWVLVKCEHLPALERRLPAGAHPVVLLERAVGDDEYVVLGSPAAPRKPVPGGRPR